MKITTMYKRVDNQDLVVVGIFTKAEIQALKAEGYRNKEYNKHGIRVA